MPAPSQTVFDGFQSCRHPIPAGLSYQHEPAVAIFPADVREPEEVERFWFAFSPDGTVFGSEAAELHQTGFLRVNRESELPQYITGYDSSSSRCGPSPTLADGQRGDLPVPA